MPPPRSVTSNAQAQSLEHWRQLLGRKVSLRYRLDSDSEWPFTEVVGVVMSAEDSAAGRQITIMDKHGSVHEVTLHDIVAVKVFPL